MTTVGWADDIDWEVERASSKWWIMLISGIAWIVIGVIVLDFDFDSAATVGFLVGGYLILAGATEFMLGAVSLGWRWVHIILGVLFVIGGIAAFFEPVQTFGILARLFGFLLVLKGSFDFVFSVATRHEIDLWWMLLLAGIFEIALGLWASAYPGRSATLLILWVGIAAVVRGITHFMIAFRVRRVHEAVTA
jgi:uncharacterized membrane protein HdeD (DUF308 family)